MGRIIVLCLLFTNLLLAQQSQDKITYTDSLGVEVSSDNKFYTKVVKDYYLEKDSYQFLTYYKNGQLKKESTISGKDGGFPIGEEIEYYENGNKKSTLSYVDKKTHGKATEWYENGQLKKEGEYDSQKVFTDLHYRIISFWAPDGRKTVTEGNGSYEESSKLLSEKGNYKNGYKDGQWTGSEPNITFVETYKNGTLAFGESTNADGTKNQYDFLMKKPEPKKGMNDFYKFIGNNFNTSDEAYKKKIAGRIIIGFIVEKDGQIVETKVVKSLGYGLDEEAIRVLLAYEKWEPAVQRGRNVRCSFQIPIAIQAID